MFTAQRAYALSGGKFWLGIVTFLLAIAMCVINMVSSSTAVPLYHFRDLRIHVCVDHQPQVVARGRATQSPVLHCGEHDSLPRAGLRVSAPKHRAQRNISNRRREDVRGSIYPITSTRWDLIEGPRSDCYRPLDADCSRPICRDSDLARHLSRLQGTTPQGVWAISRLSSVV